uniref:Uncharacterized protein n=1 Tax=Chelydra serpentina TaxID=8475 RepID=A0A8C3TBM6_CHESE
TCFVKRTSANCGCVGGRAVTVANRQERADAEGDGELKSVRVNGKEQRPRFSEVMGESGDLSCWVPNLRQLKGS